MTWTAQEKSRLLAEYHRSLSIALTQRRVRTRVSKEPPARNTILRWELSLQNRGSAARSARSGRPRSSYQRATKVQDLFQEAPTLSIRATERQLNIPRSSIERILR